MRARSVIFAFFAFAILLSMVREWNAPAACVRALLPRSTQIQSSN